MDIPWYERPESIATEQYRWSDQRIFQALNAADQMGTPSKSHSAFFVLMEMRNDYEAHIANLEARLAQWRDA